MPIYALKYAIYSVLCILLYDVAVKIVNIFVNTFIIDRIEIYTRKPYELFHRAFI